MLFHPSGILPPIFFREKDDGGGGAPPPAADPTTPPAKSSPAAPPTSGDPSPAPQEPEVKDGKGSGEEIKFTPAALKERLDRAQNSAKADMAKALGFESVDTLQKAVKEGQKALRDKMSEQERIQADIAAAQQATQAANARAEIAEQAATQARLEAASLGLMAGKFADPKLAFRLLDMEHVDLADPQFKGLDAAINALAAAAPWTLLTNNQHGRNPLAPPIGPTNPDQTISAGKTDAERRQQYFGGGVKDNTFFKGGGVRIQSGPSQPISKSG